MTRVRLRTLLLAVAVAALGAFVLRDVTYINSAAFTLYWRGHQFASAAKATGFYGVNSSEYRVTVGKPSTNVEVTIRVGK